MARRKRKAARNARGPRSEPIPRAAAAVPPEPVHYDGMTLGLGAIVVAAAGLLYGATAARDIVVGDTPEFIAAAVTLGVSHGPGYPLFTLTPPQRRSAARRQRYPDLAIPFTHYDGNQRQ